MPAALRLPFDAILDELTRVLRGFGFGEERGALCARLFAEASRDGVASHGLNRFPRFVETIRRGVVDVHAEPERVAVHGALERWDGRRGPGNLNAWASMARAVALARAHGVGCVALCETNHWMRGGTYGWQAAEAGVVAMCWTNTLPNLPPWGARSARVGNNPLVLAVPRLEGHVVLDMAMSQFSYGALASYRMRGEKLPVPGGYDADGRLTDDPGAVEASGRPLPIGYWKGSGLALLLDLMGAVLAGGLATFEIPTDPLLESGLSQVFVAFDPAVPGDPARVARTVDAVVDAVVADLHGAEPVGGDDVDDGEVFYPGERTLRTRRENLERGVPVDPAVWEEIRSMP